MLNGAGKALWTSVSNIGMVCVNHKSEYDSLRASTCGIYLFQ